MPFWHLERGGIVSRRLSYWYRIVLWHTENIRMCPKDVLWGVIGFGLGKTDRGKPRYAFLYQNSTDTVLPAKERVNMCQPLQQPSVLSRRYGCHSSEYQERPTHLQTQIIYAVRQPICLKSRVGLRNQCVTVVVAKNWNCHLQDELQRLPSIFRGGQLTLGAKRDTTR